MTCSVTAPWPCESPTAGGTHPLGAILCPRHLAGVLVPIKAPDLDRAALRKSFRVDRSAPVRETRASAIDPVTLAAIVALAPLGAVRSHDYPTPGEKRGVRMPSTGVGNRSRVVTLDDPAVPSRARSAAKKATSSGWRVRASVVDDLLSGDCLLRCTRGDDFVTLSWRDGKFHRAWRLGCGQLEQLGLNAAVSYLSTACTVTEGGVA